MTNEPRIGPTESSRMVDAEQRLLASMRSNRQQRLKIGPGRGPVAETFGQRRNRRRLKQAADRKFDIKARTDTADHTRRKQRMAPEREEVVVDPNPLQAQNLGKQSAQQFLLRTARQTQNTRTNLRRRQRTAVKLPVRRQRKMIQNNDRRRHHVVGKARPNMRPQRRRIRSRPRRQNNIANKLLAPRPTYPRPTPQPAM